MPPVPVRSPVAVPGAPGVATPSAAEPLAPGRLVHVALAVFGIGAIASGPGAVALKVMVTLPPASMRAMVAPTVVPLVVSVTPVPPTGVIVRAPTLVNGAGKASVTTTSNAGAAPAAFETVSVKVVLPPVVSNAAGLADFASETTGSAIVSVVVTGVSVCVCDSAFQ